MAAHHPHCWPPLRQVAGLTQLGIEFSGLLAQPPPFDVDCAGCCIAFLTRERNYNVGPGFAAMNVVYPPPVGNLAPNLVNFFLKVSRQNNGQVATQNDPNLGNIGPRPLQNGRTYQIYTPVAQGHVLSLGVQGVARVECTAIVQLLRADLENGILSTADAALLELYRRAHNAPSLQGRCRYQNPNPPPAPPAP